uniref:Putative secreted protein n=1 Tax=Anopheles darlingi TaxID=43151 RepID=A0A2M4DDG3_ANODA
MLAFCFRLFRVRSSFCFCGQAACMAWAARSWVRESVDRSQIRSLLGTEEEEGRREAGCELEIMLCESR